MNMPLEQQMMQQQPPSPADMPDQGKTGAKDSSAEDELDLKIAVLLGQHLLQDGGFDVIDKAVKSSKDPGQVIGQFLMQMGQQMMESMPDDIKLSPKILLARGGWVEQISDYIQEKAHVKKEIMDKAEIYIASTAQHMAQAKGGNVDGVPPPPTPQAGDPNAAPAMPAPAMPPQGGV